MLTDYLDRNDFQMSLLEALLKFVPDHSDTVLKNSKIDYKTYGSPRQVRLKEILQFSAIIGTVLDDIDLTFQFLNKDRGLILVHYPELKYQEEYYRYHFENLYIRLASILDLIGKLGNDIYNLNIPSKKVSAYNFKDKAKKEGFDDISQITENLITQIEKFKKARHSKLHSGESKFDLLDKIVIWEDLLTFSDSETDPILQKYTDEEISKKLQEYKNETIEVVKTIRLFLTESTNQLMIIVNSKD